MHRVKCHIRRLSTLQQKGPSSHEIRKTFLEFFEKSHGHLIMPSAPVVQGAKPDAFIHSGVGLFRDEILDLKAPLAARIANCQKCVRIKSKHNDFSLVGTDGTHHTFFEMLGNWSFEDYFKKEACAMSWELLTKVYGIPPERLYVTYFGGDEGMGLEPDTETCEIWKEIGVKPERVVPFGAKDNFWAFGYLGPCGPCTEIHYDAVQGRKDARALLNKGDPTVTELWNMVFMQYLRDDVTEMKPLGKLIVDTGMGFERLVAVLQGCQSNYDTDLFYPLFKSIGKMSNCPEYGGKYDCNLDTSYRILADHVRMLTVSINDGILPHMNHRLRKVMKRAFRISKNVFKVEKGLVMDLSARVVETLAPVYPDLAANLTKIQKAIEEGEKSVAEQEILAFHRWMELVKRYPQLAKIQTDWSLDAIGSVKHFIRKYVGNNRTCVKPEDAWNLYDTHGMAPDLIAKTCKTFGIEFDAKAYDTYEEDMVRDMSIRHEMRDYEYVKQNSPRSLLDRGIPKTERLAQDETKASVKVVGFLVNNAVVDSLDPAELKAGDRVDFIFDKTHFFPLTSNHMSDTGVFVTEDGVFFNITEVRMIGNYVAHSGTFLQRLKEPIAIGKSGVLEVDKNVQEGRQRGCTAAHLLCHCLSKRFPSMKILKSEGRDDRFKVVFTVSGDISPEEDMSFLEASLQGTVRKATKVNCNRHDLSQFSQLDFVRKLGEYPSERDIAMIELEDDLGVKSRHMCTGCHVRNTRHLQDIILVDIRSTKPRIREITGVTGNLVEEARRNSMVLEAIWKLLEKGEYDRTIVTGKDHISAVRMFIKKEIPKRALSSFRVRSDVEARAKIALAKLQRKKTKIDDLEAALASLEAEAEEEEKEKKKKEHEM